MTDISFESISQSFTALSTNLTQLTNVVESLVNDAQRQQIKPSQDIQQLSQTLITDIETTIQQGQQTLNQVQHLQVLVSTSSEITASLNLDDVLTQVIETSRQISGASHVGVLLKDQSREGMSVKASYGWATESLQALITTHQSLIDTALNTGEPQIADRVTYIPLVIRNQALGVVVTGQSEQHFEESDISAILAAFGNQAAIAIQNARLFAQVKADLDAAREQAQRLKIQIDQSHTDSQIDEITNSDFFRRLQEAKRDND